jgi:hypothetical protein
MHTAFRQLPVLCFPARKDGLPKNGLYILFEQGETGHNGSRIVRVGSHTGPGNLPNRLLEHTTANKDRSIFRKNIGRALLNRAQDPFLEQWNWDLTSREKRATYGPRLDTNRQQNLEEAVTRYVVENLYFVVITVEDRTDRLTLEKALIATVAQCPRCKPSSNWLGNFSPVSSIRTSGLWLKQHLNGETLSRVQLQWLSRLP